MNIPKLRFKADDGENYPDWELSSVDKKFNFVDTKNKNQSITNVITNSAEFGLLPQRDFFKKDIANKDNIDEYYIIHKGDFVYNPRQSANAPFGPFNLYEIDEPGIVSPLYTCLTPLNKEWATYLSYYFQSNRWHNYVTTHGGKGARQGRVNMSKALMKGIPISMPTIAEQRKISNFLSAVDNVIAKQQAEIKAWEQYKKGVAQKLFDQEVRFKADDGSDFPEWKQMSLDEACCINPKTGPLADKFYYMDLNSVDSGHWNEPQLLNKAEAPSRARRVADLDDVFFQSVRPYNMGHYHFTQKRDKQVVASTGFIQARMRNGCNNFLYHLFFESRFNENINILCKTSNYPAINATEFGKIAVLFPSAPEQRKIAECLDAIDDVITLAKAELEKWRELKKGLLQQLFV